MANLWPGRLGPQVNYISEPPTVDWQEAYPRSVVILGSTGSIGRNTLAVLAKARDKFQVMGLACGRNIELLAQQAELYRPPYLAVQTEKLREELVARLAKSYRPEIWVGQKGYALLASIAEATTVVSAQAGAAGLTGTLAAVLAHKVVCLANKESLVLAGNLVRDLCAQTHAVILPVDSEHNALFQCLAGRGQDVESLILTASGGPFLGKSAKELAQVTVEQALKHPNWQMGQKISIDSATMMNKGLEIIEAVQLYGVAPGQVEVLIHPQSIVHSLVRFQDGGLLGQFAVPDMQLPIAHCLMWPKALPHVVEKASLQRGFNLSFLEPDPTAFPCLSLAQKALEERGGMCVVLNAANEAAVELFLGHQCGFMDIPGLIALAMEEHAATNPGHAPLCPPLNELLKGQQDRSLADIVAELTANIQNLDRHTREFVRACQAQGACACKL
ncbi:MAG: 1-deoxy-D-xylulose-5-phosphate reductoisomerase [Desulfovibrionaceae bacterium]|nr:1-deoxy-D-xylulose-5-phosphate reductoisomerase [Desulfovibrionaceae bacterium]